MTSNRLSHRRRNARRPPICKTSPTPPPPTPQPPALRAHLRFRPDHPMDPGVDQIYQLFGTGGLNNTVYYGAAGENGWTTYTTATYTIADATLSIHVHATKTGEIDLLADWTTDTLPPPPLDYEADATTYSGAAPTPWIRLQPV